MQCVFPSELLHVGDIIKEVNGISVFVPEDMMIVLKEAEESITFKIVPSSMDKLQTKAVRNLEIICLQSFLCIHTHYAVSFLRVKYQIIITHFICYFVTSN